MVVTISSLVSLDRFGAHKLHAASTSVNVHTRVQNVIADFPGRPMQKHHRRAVAVRSFSLESPSATTSAVSADFVFVYLYESHILCA